MRYEDFEVKLESDGGRGYLVQVLSSPAGQASDVLGPLAPWMRARMGVGSPGDEPVPPSPRTRLASWLAARGRRSRPSATAGRPAAPRRRDLDLAAAPGLSGLAAREMGTALWAALFNGSVRDLYNRSIGVVSKLPGHGLRLKLHFSLARPGLAPLSALPWELLFRADTQEFLSLNRQTPVVRYLEIPQPPQSLALAPPLRVLIVVASPTDLAPLDLDQELSELRSSLAGRQQLELHLLTRATTRPTKFAFRDALLAQRFQAVHFMGHGDLAEGTGLGRLVFENAAGESDPVTGEELSVYLRQAPSVRLAFLNACNTARAARRDGLDPFAGVATALILGGLPAVIAMQLAVSDPAAITFSAAFYQRLATSMPIDTAVTEARLALYSRAPTAADWGAPVLFLRTGDGKLFDLSSIPVDEKREAARLVAAAPGHQLDAFVRARSAAAAGRRGGPPTLSDLESAQRRIDLASVQGDQIWIQLSEALLAALSPFSPFAGALQGLAPQLPHDVWRNESGDVLGLGADLCAADAIPGAPPPPGLAARSTLTWQGLRFRDGSFSARLWWPDVGGGGGLALRHAAGRGALLGLLRRDGGGDGALMAELWQQEGAALVLLGAAALPARSPDGWHEAVLRLAGRRASWRVGGAAVQGRLAADIAAGHAALVKTGGSAIRFRNARLTVHDRGEPAFTAESWR